MSAYRDRYSEFAGTAQVLGVSMDKLETQAEFAEALKAPFPLLADADGTVSKAYGVWNEAGYASRVTFVIDRDGKVKAVFEGKDALDPAGALGACPKPHAP
jgi:thioredoxin-dependent peroxiredoxin